MKIFHIPALIVIICCGCTGGEAVDRIYDFAVVCTVIDYDSIYSDRSDRLGRFRKIEIVDGVIVAENAQDDHMFSFIDTEKGELTAKWGRIGRGPDEYIQIGSGFSIHDSHLVFMDVAKKEINYVPLSNILSGTGLDIRREPYPYNVDSRPNHIVLA